MICFYFQLLSKSLEQIGDEDWYMELGNSMSGQLALYDKCQEDKVTLVEISCPYADLSRFILRI